MSAGTHEVLALHDIEMMITQQDIYTFLSHRLQIIQRERNAPQGWPSDHDIQLLADKASGLLIFAETACRYIQNAKYDIPEMSLALFLQENTTSSPYSALYEMYTQVLEGSILADVTGDERDNCALWFREIAGPIVVLAETLPLTTLSKLIRAGGGVGLQSQERICSSYYIDQRKRISFGSR